METRKVPANQQAITFTARTTLVIWTALILKLPPEQTVELWKRHLVADVKLIKRSVT